MKILVIGAHSDDIEYGCAGFLAKHLEHEIYYIIATLPQDKEHSEIRKQEALNAASISNIRNIFFLDLEDGTLQNNKITRAKIRNIYKQLNPDLILCHSPHDTHPDHVAISLACLDACRDASNIIMFRSYTTSSFNPNLFIDISDTIEQKRKIISCFKSQIQKYKDSSHIFDAMILENQLYGNKCNCEYAEAFEIKKILL